MGSNGGHGHLEDDEKRDYKTYLLDIEDKSINVQHIVKIEKGHEVCKDNESGVRYFIKLSVAYYPGEEKFSYDSEEERDTRLTKLRGKLAMRNVIFV